jgi:hypothetical protein
MKLLIWCMSLFLLSCMNSQERIKKWMKANGIEQIKVGDTQMTSKILSYHPNDTLGSSFLYMDVRLDKQSGIKMDKTKELYADFDIEKDFALKINNSQLPAGFCQRIQNGKENSYEYIVAFNITPKDFNSNGITLLYKDQIFGIGSVAFDYEESYLKNHYLKVEGR